VGLGVMSYGLKVSGGSSGALFSDCLLMAVKTLRITEVLWKR
jgi:hypothetical protein